MRRQGAAGTLRNLCLSAEADGTLGSLLGSTAWLAALLDVLCGAHKVRREVDDGVREALSETVLMLVQLPPLLLLLLLLWCSVRCQAYARRGLSRIRSDTLSAWLAGAGVIVVSSCCPDGVREALCETVLMLVKLPLLLLPMRCSVRGPIEQGVWRTVWGALNQPSDAWREGAALADSRAMCLSAQYEGADGSYAGAIVLEALVALQAQTEAGRKSLWSIDAPVTLRTG